MRRYVQGGEEPSLTKTDRRMNMNLIVDSFVPNVELSQNKLLKTWILSDKPRSVFLRIFKVALLLFLATAGYSLPNLK